jgi:hypothetical protein
MATYQPNNAISNRQAIWSYIKVNNAPVAGPQPRLAQGSGRTGDVGLPGNAASLPGYLSDNMYQPEGLDYMTSVRESYLNRIPASIGVGDDGLHALNPTYRAHEVKVADRFNHQMRQANSWQNMAYPPSYRNLLQYAQVQKYQVYTNTLSPRILPKNNYFLGYQMTEDMATQIGGSSLGSL